MSLREIFAPTSFPLSLIVLIVVLCIVEGDEDLSCHSGHESKKERKSSSNEHRQEKKSQTRTSPKDTKSGKREGNFKSHVILRKERGC